MGRSANWLSAEGIAVLSWVGDGCPDPGTTTEEIGRRITASALAKRGLVSVSGRGASWRASITRAGLAWLAAHPQAGPVPADEAADLAGQVSELIAQVVAGGRFSVPEGDESRALHERLVELSHTSPERPKGRRLRLRLVDGWRHLQRYEVVLVRYAGDLADLPLVPVPERVARYHPAVRAFLAHGSRRIGKDHRSRAARILQAIADEAPRRGISASAPEEAAGPMADGRAAGEIRRGDLVLRTPAGLYPVRILEQTVRVEPPPVAERPGSRPPPPWMVPAAEYVGTGRLELLMDGPGTGYQGDRYRDTARTALEDRLPGLFQDLELHRVVLERREQERRREEAERQRRWEAAMAEARRRYDEQQRWAAFERSSRDWRTASQHRQFLAVARKAAERFDGPEREDLLAHLDFAEQRIEALDPLGDVRAMVCPWPCESPH